MTKTPNQSVSSLEALKPEAADQVKAAAKAVSAPAVPPGVPVVTHPGVERWPVKTGTDADVSKVGVNSVSGKVLGPGLVDTTVEEMLTFARAANMPPVKTQFPKNSFYQNHRAVPTETTVWRLKAEVTLAKLEQDGDYHLVLKGASGKTMIGEIPKPDPAYVGNAVWRADILTARNAVDKQVGKALAPVDFNPAAMAPPTRDRFETGPMADETAAMTPVGAQATIIGVGFFDSDHGQIGVAPSAIEIHPILSIVFGQ